MAKKEGFSVAQAILRHFPNKLVVSLFRCGWSWNRIEYQQIVDCLLPLYKTQGGCAMTIKEQRIQNLIDATNFREPEKVPVGANFMGWPFSYAGVKYTDLMDDPKKAAEAYVKIFDDCELDFYYGFGVAQPVKAYQELGCFCYDFGEEGTYVMNPQVEDIYCGSWIYDDIIKDPEKFYFDTYLKLRLPVLNAPRDEAYTRLKKALQEHRKLVEFNNLVNRYLSEEKQLANFRGSPLTYSSPLTIVFCMARGIRNTLIDLKRMPEKVYAACDATWALKYAPGLLAQQEALAQGAQASEFPWITGSYHPEAFVSQQDFEAIFFKYFRQGVIPLLEKGMKYYLMGEGSFINTVDKYREAPKGSVIIQIDTDDPFDMHKKIGDWATIVCGLKAGMLAVASKQECTDTVKRYFDTFAPGGGFIFMPHYPLMSSTEAKAENLIAMYETANELSRK